MLNMRSDKTLQDIVYKLVPGLHEDEMRRRKTFYSQNAYSNEGELQAYKEERDKIFFCEYDQISLSLQYFDAAKAKGKTPQKPHEKPQQQTPNKNLRYLRCPGMLKIKHLKKFVANKYGLNNQFVVSNNRFQVN